MNKKNISEKTIIKTICHSVNHTRFSKEDHLPDWARWDNKVTKGDRVDTFTPGFYRDKYEIYHLISYILLWSVVYLY